MCFLLFTIPADEDRARLVEKKKKRIASFKKVITWFLLIVWVFLISFALIASREPDWLKGMSKFGRAGEANTLVDYGDNLLMQKNYPQAIAQYQKAVQIKPDYTGAFVNMAIAYSMTGEHEKGLQVLENAITKTDKQKGTIYFNMADILRRQGKYDLAVEYYTKAIGSEVEQDLVYQRLGSLYLEMGNLDEAGIALEKTLQIQTDLSTPFVKMLYRSLPFLESDTAHAPVIKAMLARGVSAGDLSEFCTEIIDSLNNRNPEIAKVHNHLGYIFARQNNPEKAIYHFEKSLAIWPNNIDAVKNLQLLRKAVNQKQAVIDSGGPM